MESDKVYTVVEGLCVEDVNVLDSCEYSPKTQCSITQAFWYWEKTFNFCIP